MSDHEPGDAKHEHETPMLHAQEHKGYGEDEASARRASRIRTRKHLPSRTELGSVGPGCEVSVDELNGHRSLSNCRCASLRRS